MKSRICGSAMIIALGLWMLCFVCLGYSKGGKEWYSNVASYLFVESDAVPIMNIAIPILLSGTIATIFMYQPTATAMPNESALPSLLPTFIHRCYHRWRTTAGDMKRFRFNIYFICCPLILMTLVNIHRHLYGQQLSLDDQLMEIGNTFGFVALVAMSYFLIPVARQSPILKLFQISPTAAVHVHIWSGRIIGLGVLLHASFHLYRWKGLARESILAMLFPPIQCFTVEFSADTSYHNYFQPVCVDEDTDCQCYDLLRNFIGLMALLGLFVIAVTSFNYVRRTHYRFFYTTHVLVAPTVILLTILHYNKSILYVSPSVIYYIATSFPVMAENRDCCAEKGIKPTRVERIKSSIDRRQRECISLTFKAHPAAIDMLCSGQYVKLGAPKLSSIDHPFTVNRVPGSKAELRIIFRVMGKFTNRLCDHLINPVNDVLPIITIDGFHGPQNRVEQLLRHDVVVIVGGGIGITPFLSLLEDVHNALASTENRVTKEIILHWICREQALIDFVVKNYFDPLLANSQSNGFKIQIIIHKTHSPYSTVEPLDGAEIPREARPVRSSGGAFCPSLYSAGAGCSRIHVLIATLTFSTISWISLWSVMAFYHTNHAKEEIIYRLFSPLCILAIGLVMSWLAKLLFPISERRDAMSLRLHDGAVFSRVDNDDTAGMEGVLGHNDVHSAISPKGQPSSFPSASGGVTIEHKEGSRPTVHSLLKYLDSTRCPGLVMCGPVSLMNDLRNAAAERCSIRRCQCIPGDPYIAVYEEQFEM